MKRNTVSYNPIRVLSIVSLPIGNLGDITLRAIETLKACDGIVCEDTRVTGHLLHQLNLPKKELMSFHSHSDEGKLQMILEKLRRGQHLCLVCDAGTPCISDPGYRLVSQVRTLALSDAPAPIDPHNATKPFAIEVIPGPSAFLAALSASGLPIHHFRYLGFLPLKKGRKRLIEQFKDVEETIVFYESVHRIERTIAELADALHDQPQRSIVIGRELTKLFEEVIQTTVEEARSRTAQMKKKGEFVVVIGPLLGRHDMTPQP